MLALSIASAAAGAHPHRAPLFSTTPLSPSCVALAAAADRSEEHVLSLNDILAIGGALGCEGIHTDPSYASRMASTFATFDFDGGGMYSVAKARAHAAAVEPEVESELARCWQRRRAQCGLAGATHDPDHSQGRLLADTSWPALAPLGLPLPIAVTATAGRPFMLGANMPWNDFGYDIGAGSYSPAVFNSSFANMSSWGSNTVLAFRRQVPCQR